MRRRPLSWLPLPLLALAMLPAVTSAAPQPAGAPPRAAAPPPAAPSPALAPSPGALPIAPPTAPPPAAPPPALAPSPGALPIAPPTAPSSVGPPVAPPAPFVGPFAPPSVGPPVAPPASPPMAPPVGPPGPWGAYPPPVGPTGWGVLPEELGPPPPPVSASAAEPTLSRAGLPLGQRGAIGVDTASFTRGDGDSSGAAIVLAASMPFTGTTFFDARVPLGLSMDHRTDATLGNVMIGAHHVMRPGQRAWITLGGAVGLPMLSTDTHRNSGYEPPGAARGYWDLHEYFPDILPIHARLGGEIHVGPVIFRLALEPALYLPIGANDDFEEVVQQAVEVQIGHAIGGGLRVQGAAFPTFDDLDGRHETERDLFQLSLEPFLVLERKLAFLRTGLLLPIDRQLGPPLDHSWGFRLALGVRVE